MAKKKLLIVRGLPGSGKSTFSKRLEKEYGFVHLESDMFFSNKFGEFEYDKSKLSDAHEWCRLETKSQLLENDVVVSNTFTTWAEIEPYAKLAKKFRANFAIICCEGNYGSIHNVPEDIIENMRSRFEKINGEVLQKNVNV
jgi:tRNA uridine 5-carbamoylmethylation protein Kti12